MRKADQLSVVHSQFLAEFSKILTGREYDKCPFNTVKMEMQHQINDALGMQKVIFEAHLRDGLRDLANSVNDLLLKTLRLEAWQSVLKFYETDGDRNLIIFNFIQPEAESALILPYSIKSRFFYAAAHISHAANRIILSNVEYADDELNLPNDDRISENVAAKPMKNWRRSKGLFKSLSHVNTSNFKERTGNFRNKFAHRYAPRIEVGTTSSIGRDIGLDGRATYILFQKDSLPLKTAIDALHIECTELRGAFSAFEALVLEQKSKVDSYLSTAT